MRQRVTVLSLCVCPMFAAFKSILLDNKVDQFSLIFNSCGPWSTGVHYSERSEVPTRVPIELMWLLSIVLNLRSTLPELRQLPRFSCTLPDQIPVYTRFRSSKLRVEASTYNYLPAAIITELDTPRRQSSTNCHVHVPPLRVPPSS